MFKGGGDAVSSARSVLETGEFDYAWNLQVAPEILSEMEKKGKGKVIAAFGTYVERLMVNFTNPDPALGENRSEYMDGKNPHPFLTDYAVRRALSLAIDRQILVDAGYGQAGVVACNVLAGPEIYRSDANEEGKTQNQRGSTGHSGLYQRNVETDWCRNRTEEPFRISVLRWRPGQPGYLPEVLYRHRNVYQRILWYRSRDVYVRLDLL